MSGKVGSHHDFTITPKKLTPHFPQLRKKLLRDSLLKVLRPERTTGARCCRSDDSLDELDVKKPPHREPLLVLQQSLGEHLERALILFRVDLLVVAIVRDAEIVERLLDCRPGQR